MRKTKTELPERRTYIDQTAEQFGNEIKFSVQNSHVYGPERPLHIPGDEKPYTYISTVDSVTALAYSKGKTAILNFADYTRRGGLFVYGGKAQEEALCGASDLWNVLNALEFDEYFAWNKANQNDYLYYDRAIYSPDIVFHFADGKQVKADVLSCAAPYKAAAGRYKGVSTADAQKAMSKRIVFVRNVLEQEHVETAILGAYGCGVFGNNTKYVAECFARTFKDTSIKNVVYAMPDQKKRQVFEKAMKL